MAITAGIGSDHVDLQAAMDRKVDVVEVTYCNSRSTLRSIAACKSTWSEPIPAVIAIFKFGAVSILSLVK
jgi:phosphoglycerate dehydrogenase-like enzyme